MKKLLSLLLFLSISSYLLAQENQTAKSCYYQAKAELENMLTGKQKPDYEEAIFLIENAWYENRIDRKQFASAIEANIEIIQDIIKSNYNPTYVKQKPNYLLTQKQINERYTKALMNWAIYTFITENVCAISDSDKAYIHYKYNYSYTDPMATDDWTNTQVTHLNYTKSGNCFALASMFKILSNRLNSGANLCTAPSHIYIRHSDEKGTKHNIELGTKNFPGTGTISTITYSTDEAVQNNISQRELTPQQEIALCFVYLAKGYEHKFSILDDPFILECAEIALRYDDRNLNALLLKAEYLENKLTTMKKSVSALQNNKDFQVYENLIAELYLLGYREMPIEMKNQIIRSYIKDEPQQKYKLISPITPKGRYATLSWGMFDERQETKSTERIGNTVFNTKTKKITAFSSDKKLYNGYNFDPVVFAWNIDPLFQMYPGISPYAFVANSPIMAIDPDGRKLVIANDVNGYTLSQLQKLTSDKLAINSKTGEVYIQKATAGKIKAQGTQLLRDVIGHNRTTTINYKENAVGSGTTYDNKKNAHNGGGVQVSILFTKNNGAAQYNVNGKTKSLQQKAYIVLGGELIHALVAMDGHKDPSGNGSHTYTDIFGEKRTETRDKDELATHGVSGWHYNPSMYRKSYPTENDLRKENNEPERVSYEDEMEYKYRPENKQKLEQYERQQKR